MFLDFVLAFNLKPLGLCGTVSPKLIPSLCQTWHWLTKDTLAVPMSAYSYHVVLGEHTYPSSQTKLQPTEFPYVSSLCIFMVKSSPSILTFTQNMNLFSSSKQLQFLFNQEYFNVSQAAENLGLLLQEQTSFLLW